jgi:hypothetical protein
MKFALDVPVMTPFNRTPACARIPMGPANDSGTSETVAHNKAVNRRALGRGSIIANRLVADLFAAREDHTTGPLEGLRINCVWRQGRVSYVDAGGVAILPQW